MKYSVALTTGLHQQAADHLLRPDGQEDLAFALWHPSQGQTRLTALLAGLLEPRRGDRQVHGNASFYPAYFERALSEARAAGAGLAFMHSHPGPGWQGMSHDDVVAEQRMAGAALAATGQPLLGLTLGTDGAWSGRVWERTAPRTYARQWCQSVRVVGERLAVTYHPELAPAPNAGEEQSRSVSAWGEQRQADLARLHVGIIGAGSVGSIVAEALARSGFAELTLLDFDTVEKRNLDRQLHATRLDAWLSRSKVSVLAKAIRKSATACNFEVHAYEWSITEESGFRAALDCDVLFACVDRPWPRSILNHMSYGHLIPVVDGGVHVETRAQGQGLRSATWRAHIAAPSRRCLACLGQYDPGLVSVERDGYLNDPTYVAGLPPEHILRRGENVFAFSLAAAALEVLQLLAIVIAPAGLSNPGAQRAHFPLSRLETDLRACEANCLFPNLTATGDHSGLVVTGDHPSAQAARELRTKTHRGWPNRLRRWWAELRGL